MSAEPLNHDRGCTPCIGKCLREGELPSCFFQRGGLTGDRTRIIPIRALHSLCWRRSGPARRTRGRRARSRCNLRRRKLKNIHRIFFRPCGRFHAGCGRGNRWDEKQRPDTSRPLFFCAENLISASRRLRLRPTPALHSAPASLWSPLGAGAVHAARQRIVVHAHADTPARDVDIDDVALLDERDISAHGGLRRHMSDGRAADAPKRPSVMSATVCPASYPPARWWD